MPVINSYISPKRKMLTKAQRQEVYDKCKGHCAYCGCELEFKDMQVDHLIPLSGALTGGISGADELSNMLPACRSCNLDKSSFPLEWFRKNIEHFPEMLMRDNATYRKAVRFGLVEPKPHKVEFYFEKLGIEVPT